MFQKIATDTRQIHLGENSDIFLQFYLDRWHWAIYAMFCPTKRVYHRFEKWLSRFSIIVSMKGVFAMETHLGLKVVLTYVIFSVNPWQHD